LVIQIARMQSSVAGAVTPLGFSTRVTHNRSRPLSPLAGLAEPSSVPRLPLTVFGCGSVLVVLVVVGLVGL
jgi:hypothetical protein